MKRYGTFSPMRAGLTIVLCAPAMLVAGMAVAADAVRVRAWDHASHARLVLDWPQPVQFTAAVKDGRLKAQFDRAFVANFKPAMQRLAGYMRAIRVSPDGRSAEFELTGDYRLVAFAHDRAVVFDLLPRHRRSRAVKAGGPIRFADRVRSAERKSAESGPHVAVRIGRHADYVRLVFDWADSVGYRVEQQAESVSIRFDKNARIDGAALARRLSAGLRDPVVRAEGAGTTVSIATPSGIKVRHFRLGPKVVLDFVHGADAKTKSATDKNAAKAKKTAANPRRGDEPTPPSKAPRAPVEATALLEPAAPSAEPSADSPTAASGTGQDSTRAAADLSGSSESGEPSAADGSGTAKLVFEWPEPVGAAVFLRDPYVWIVFDRRAQLDIAALRDAGKGMISKIEQLPIGSGTVLRLEPMPGVNPQVDRQDFNWVVSFRKWPVSPQVPIALRVRPEAVDGAELELPVSEFGQVIHLADPEVGDMMLVTTLRAPGHGIVERRRYPEFEILPSAQGVAIDPLSDDVEIKEAGERGIVVTAPGGLHVSAIPEGGERDGSFLGPRLFNFSNWLRRDDGAFVAARQAALRAVVEADDDRRDDARLDLARFYFAHGFAAEALGVLRTIETTNEAVASQPEFRALVGATLVYMGRPQEARKDLFDPRLDAFQEIAVWRGSIFHQAGEVKKAAAQFRAGEPVLQSYPEPIRTKLTLERVEASLAALDVGSASVWLNYLGKMQAAMPRKHLARLLYNQGVLARDSRDLDRAVELWSKAKATGDRWNAARAEFALVELGLQQETITAGEATERFEKLRFGWRGDRLELAVLKRLGELYLAKADFRKGLNTLRTAVTYFPDTAKVKAVAQLMSASFKELHLDGGADKLAPLKALALYDDFRELTPAGPEGDLMIQRLADRLVSVDLLDRAANLLAHQVRYRLKGQEKARVGAKLALIHLLDRNPKGALSALRGSFQPNLSQTLEDDRRRIRAKGTLELSRFEEAIALLAGDVSREADLLRADIYWSTQNYSEAAKVLQRLSGDPLAEGGYDEDQAGYVLNWAVALRLKRDEAGLRMLRELYGPGMAESTLADSFSFVASPAASAATNIETITRKIAEADKFEAFLKNYRERLIKPSGGKTAAGMTPSGKRAAETPPSAKKETAAPTAIPAPPPPPRG